MLFGPTTLLIYGTFSIILSEVAHEWFAKLFSKSISSFRVLDKEFKLNFITYQLPKKPTTLLLAIRQEEEKCLKSYARWFNDEVHLVVDPIPSGLIISYISMLQPSWFFYKVITPLLTIFLNLWQEANYHIVIESIIAEK